MVPKCNWIDRVTRVGISYFHLVLEESRCCVVECFQSITYDACHIYCANTARIDYHQIANTRRTKPKNLNISRFALQLYLPDLLNPGVGPKMKM